MFENCSKTVWIGALPVLSHDRRVSQDLWTIG